MMCPLEKHPPPASDVDPLKSDVRAMVHLAKLETRRVGDRSLLVYLLNQTNRDIYQETVDALGGRDPLRGWRR